MKAIKWVGNVPTHTQIIQFTNGIKKTIKCIVRIDEGEMLCLTTSGGKEFLIDKSKVVWVERIIESEEEVANCMGKKELKNKKIKTKKIKVLQKRTGYEWYGFWIDDGKNYGATTETEIEVVDKIRQPKEKI